MLTRCHIRGLGYHSIYLWTKFDWLALPSSRDTDTLNITKVLVFLCVFNINYSPSFDNAYTKDIIFHIITKNSISRESFCTNFSNIIFEICSKLPISFAYDILTPNTSIIKDFEAIFSISMNICLQHICCSRVNQNLPHVLVSYCISGCFQVLCK